LVRADPSCFETIFGVPDRDGGEIFKNGELCKNKNALEAINNGFALLTEERRATGIFGVLSIKENATIASLDHYMTPLGLNNNKMFNDTQWVISAMNVKTPSQATQIKSLSGGNQQKVIIGRWLADRSGRAACSMSRPAALMSAPNTKSTS
jgi:methyl-galactoside transport system ATP-binding protein